MGCELWLNLSPDSPIHADPRKLLAATPLTCGQHIAAVLRSPTQAEKQHALPQRRSETKALLKPHANLLILMDANARLGAHRDRGGRHLQQFLIALSWQTPRPDVLQATWIHPSGGVWRESGPRRPLLRPCAHLLGTPGKAATGTNVRLEGAKAQQLCPQRPGQSPGLSGRPQPGLRSRGLRPRLCVSRAPDEARQVGENKSTKSSSKNGQRRPRPNPLPKLASLSTRRQAMPLRRNPAA